MHFPISLHCFISCWVKVQVIHPANGVSLISTVLAIFLFSLYFTLLSNELDFSRLLTYTI